MQKFKGLAQILLSIAGWIFLYVGWDYLGDYVIVLQNTDIELFGARLFTGLAAAAFAINGAGDFFTRPAAPQPVAEEA